ncbi:hypothetical protein, partial [Streptomyces flaveus]|uniref:hypothetical protein n=1 Tax=Streptomyces flaveus TaxID=66370 RepID=UPI001ADF9B9E
MMTMAAPSETFWTALGSVAAALGVLATLYVGWLAWRTAVPRRKVRWAAEVKPLLQVTSAGVVYRRPLGDLVLRLCGEFGGQDGVVGF